MLFLSENLIRRQNSKNFFSLRSFDFSSFLLFEAKKKAERSFKNSLARVERALFKTEREREKAQRRSERNHQNVFFGTKEE
jgi:hypothetical protein